MTIRMQVEEDVACIEIARPERKNAITAEMYAQLAESFTAAGSDDAVRAVVLRGAPTVFCAGNDIHDFLQRPDSAGEFAQRFMKTMIELPKPVIAAVNGAAVASARHC